ncbi:MAG: hypothetical protein ABJB33_01245 [Gemmatimonadota bacterium]
MKTYESIDAQRVVAERDAGGRLTGIVHKTPDLLAEIARSRQETHAATSALEGANWLILELHTALRAALLRAGFSEEAITETVEAALNRAIDATGITTKIHRGGESLGRGAPRFSTAATAVK